MALRSKQWIFAAQAEDRVQVLTQELKISRVMAQILLNRGLTEPDAADAFLSPRIEDLHDPSLIPDLEKAVKRLRRAHAEREHIRIFGDYDVDGSAGAAVLVHAFRMLGIEHSTRLPSRGGDGYGLSVGAVDQAINDGVEVLVTVDNGVAANAAIAKAQGFGIDVIVTDHHKYGAELPNAHALVHPGLPDSKYPCPNLCGAGVAFKLALALADSFGIRPSDHGAMRQFVSDSFAFAAMASICDMVPLTGENRIITALGLQSLARTAHPGLRALLEVAGVSGTVTSTDIGFKLGPRINAAGRMEQEDVALKLLTAREYGEALSLASELDALNRKRQGIERKVVKEAKAIVSELGDTPGPVLVVSGEGWPSGVVGLAASRLADAYERPSVVLSCDGEVATGSGRSIRSFHLYNALADCEALLQRFGGHTFAAGLTIEASKIGDLRERLCANAEKHMIFQPGVPSLDIDVAVEPNELNLGLAYDVARLEPFGEGNPEPLLAIEQARVIGRPRLVGKSANHLAFQVAPGDGPGLRAIGFKLGDHVDILSSPRGFNVAFKPIISDWTGSDQLELEVKHLAAC